MADYGIVVWYCCLAPQERDSLKYTYDNTPRFLPHVAKDVWQAALLAFGIDPTSDRYRDFTEIYLISFFFQEVGGVEVEVVDIPDEFWFALLDYYADHGPDCPDPCKPLVFSYL